MPKGLSRNVRDNLEKCRSAAVAAVDVYNRPGPRFRTAHFIVLIVLAWTALFHAISYKRGRRPWYRRPGGTGHGVRYVKVDGEPKHWELQECLRQFHGADNPAERKNLEFLLGLRNKIEHRHLPELDPSLYGECQAALLNLEALMVAEFGAKHSLAEQLAVSLQFAHQVPDLKSKSATPTISKEIKKVATYVEQFRGALDASTLNSMKYSYTVFLVPRVANRKSVDDVAIQFIKLDHATPEELARLEKLNVLIKDKHVPIANLGLLKPSEVVAEVAARIPYPMNLGTHTKAWKHYGVRPASGDPNPERTRSEYCVRDETHEDYVYTKAWVEKLAAQLSDPAEYERVTGRIPPAAA